MEDEGEGGEGGEEMRTAQQNPIASCSIIEAHFFGRNNFMPELLYYILMLVCALAGSSLAQSLARFMLLCGSFFSCRPVGKLNIYNEYIFLSAAE